jgi:hypothetical protein
MSNICNASISTAEHDQAAPDRCRRMLSRRLRQGVRNARAVLLLDRLADLPVDECARRLAAAAKSAGLKRCAFVQLMSQIILPAKTDLPSVEGPLPSKPPGSLRVVVARDAIRIGGRSIVSMKNGAISPDAISPEMGGYCPKLGVYLKSIAPMTSNGITVFADRRVTSRAVLRVMDTATAATGNRNYTLAALSRGHLGVLTVKSPTQELIEWTVHVLEDRLSIQHYEEGSTSFMREGRKELPWSDLTRELRDIVMQRWGKGVRPERSKRIFLHIQESLPYQTFIDAMVVVRGSSPGPGSPRTTSPELFPDITFIRSLWR